MTTFNGTESVKGGYYLDVREWKLEAIDGASGALPGDEGDRYIRVPVLLLLIVAPLLGLGFVVLLPFFGVAVLGEQLWHKAVAAIGKRRIATVRPTMVRRRR